MSLIYLYIDNAHLPFTAKSIARSVVSDMDRTVSFASWISCHMCSGLLSPCDQREQNSLSVTIPVTIRSVVSVFAQPINTKFAYMTNKLDRRVSNLHR